MADEKVRVRRVYDDPEPADGTGCLSTGSGRAV